MKKKILTTVLLLCLLIAIFTGCATRETDDIPSNESVDFENKASLIVKNLSSENYDPVFQYFTEDMKTVLPINDLEYLWNSLTKSYGIFQGITHVRKTEDQEYTIVYVTCSFSTLGMLDLRFVFDKFTRIAGFQLVETDQSDKYQSPAYVDFSSFTEENIIIGTNPWELPATLSIPTDGKPFPAVVLVHGSGPNNQNGTIGPNKPLKDIAHGLASRGILVLRYDKRTKIYPEIFASISQFTPEDEVIEDAIIALDYLQRSEHVDCSQIYVIGHSFGAMMTPEIARQFPTLNGAILLAIPARPLEDLYLAQYTYLLELDGIIDEYKQKQLSFIKESVENIKDMNIGTNESIFDLPYSYWKYLSTYNPIQIAQNLHIPLLILQGKRDYQVTYEDDFRIWQQTFEDLTRVTLKTYEPLNHLFIHGSGKPTNTEYFIPGNVDEQVINDISTWIREKNILNG